DIKTTSVFYYNNKLATELSGSELLTVAMNRSESFLGQKVTIDSGIKTDSVDFMSETFYTGDKGDETAHYSYNYKLSSRDIADIKTTSVFYYLGDKLATELAGREIVTSQMVRSESFRGQKTDVTAAIKTDALDFMSETFYTGDKGDETAHYSYNYKLSSRDIADIKTTSVFYYGLDKKLATELTGRELVVSPMTKSESFRGQKTDITAAIKIDSVDFMSETFYTGAKGDETAWYSYNYKLGSRNLGDIKTTSVFYYNNKLATELSGSELLTVAMNRSESFLGQKVTIDSGIKTDSVDFMSETFYTGDKGDETAHYSYNYKLSSRNLGGIKTTSVFYYLGDKLATELAGREIVTSQMVRSESFRGQKTDITAAIKIDSVDFM
ncbi:MAG: hypothetical protein Q7N87_02645, partial [Candidatus Uhrbacteria bacterium]|nr:hypothetical protein [Candidatus Uhrbacteria bacterium]